MQRVLTLVFLISSLVYCGPGSNDPEPDDCKFPNKNAEIRGLEIGETDPFTPFENEDEVRVVNGGQGSPMLQMGLRIKGTDGPGCLEQHTVIKNADGKTLGELEVPIKTYENGNFRVTESMPIIFARMPEPGSDLNITTTANGKTVVRHVYRMSGDSGYYYYR